MLTGFTQPATAHTRDIGVWQWSNFRTAHLQTTGGEDYTAENIECENVVPPIHPVLRSNGIGFGLPASLAPPVSLQCSEGKVVSQWLIDYTVVDGRPYIGLGPGLKCCGVRGMRWNLAECAYTFRSTKTTACSALAMIQDTRCPPG